MAIIKNFGLFGVGSDVQFGKAGNRVVSEEGLFKFLNTSGALVRIQAADGTEATDVATFGQLTALDDRLTGTVDTIEASVGLAEDGSFVPFSGTNYLDTATSIANALALIDAAINTSSDNAILRDGSVAFTNNQSMGGFKLTNLAEPENATDAATKEYVDSAVSILGNAFAYIGTVAGGADEENALDLTSLEATNAGSYYKVTTGGYFKIGTEGTPFYANVNDGLVFNTSGGVDTIDNTNSQVEGSVDFISVTGSSDTGFVVDIDATFKDRVSDLETGLAAAIAGAGLDTDGTYAANPSTNYLATATSLKSATELLDAAIKQVSDDLSGATQDEIVSLDGFTGVLADNAGIQFSVNKDGVRTDVGSIVGGVDTDSAFQVDLGTAGEVRFEAYSQTATDVDIRLVPQGNGQVIVGETGSNGVIQADDGFALVLAGGDNASGAAGDLILKAGSGVTPGAIFIGGDATEETTVKVTKDATSVTFAADGEATDVSIKLDPKGAGTVDVSSSRITNVADGVEATDAVNKGQLDALAATIDTGRTGSLQAITATVTAGQTTNIGSAIKGTIIRTKVVVATGFDGQLVVGDSVVTDSVVTSLDIDETTAGTYLVESVVGYSSDTQIIATAGGTVGSATVIIEYIVG